MQDFLLFFELGWKHITDLQGYDHILFVIVLCSGYLSSDWKKLLVLITAFTLGHSLTLTLSVFQLIKIPSALIEFLIPITICLSALVNITKKDQARKNVWLNYFLAMFFGLIHGLGFSNYLKSLLGHTENIVGPLFAFNIGLEFGQLLIVLLVFVFNYILVRLFRTNFLKWNLFLSILILAIAVLMAIQRFSAILEYKANY
jgi:hypothetical protein